MDYEMTIYFQQQWTDPRLAWGLHPHKDNISRRREKNMNQIHAQLVDLLWKPGKKQKTNILELSENFGNFFLKHFLDIYFDFEKHSTRDDSGNRLLDISPRANGVKFSQISKKKLYTLKFYFYDIKLFYLFWYP